MNNNIAIIIGGTGTLTPHLAAELNRNGYTVHRGSRSSKTEIQYSNNQLIDPNFWGQAIRRVAGTATSVLLINTIGSAHPPAGMTLRDVNVRPVIALATAGKEFASAHPDIQVTVVQISAIAATYLRDHPYGKSRAEADNAVVQLAQTEPLDNYEAIALQLPFVFANPEQLTNGSWRINGLQPWSMEQIAALPIVPLPGSGNQPLRPVSVRDVARAVANAPARRMSGIIQAVGGQELTQRQLIDFYAALRGRSIVYIRLPAALLAPALDLLHHGLLDGYAPRVMQKLDAPSQAYDQAPFNQLLGATPEGIEAAHADLRGQKAELAPPPVVAHMKAHSGKLTLIALGFAALGIGGYFALKR